MKVKDLLDELSGDTDTDYEVVVIAGVSNTLIEELTDEDGYIHPISISWDHHNKLLKLEL